MLTTARGEGGRRREEGGGRRVVYRKRKGVGYLYGREDISAGRD